MGKTGTSKKAERRKTRIAESLHRFDEPAENHMQVFARLIKDGPTMHGTPGAPHGGRKGG